MTFPKPIDVGSLNRRLTAIERYLQALDGSRRLAAATISEGGLTVAGGGNIQLIGGGSLDVTDEGGITVRDGGDIGVSGGGSILLSGGGLFEWRDAQGRHRFSIAQDANYPDNVSATIRDTNGTSRVLLGMMYSAETGQPSGEGILVEDHDGTDIFAIRPGRALLRAVDGDVTATAGRNVRVTADNDVYIIAENNFIIRTADDSHRIYRAGSSLYLTAPDTVGVNGADFYVWGNIGTNGNLTASGTKNFVIEHPTRPGRALVHASTESPVSGLEYTGTTTLDDDGQAVVELPDYFEALAAPDGRTVHLTPVGRPFPVGADPIDDGRFTAYGEPGRTVSWLVKARRGDTAGQFEVEPTREEAGLDPQPDTEPEPSDPAED